MRRRLLVVALLVTAVAVDSADAQLRLRARRPPDVATLQIIANTFPNCDEDTTCTSVQLTSIGATGAVTWSEPNGQLGSGACAGIAQSSSGLVTIAPTSPGMCTWTALATSGTQEAARQFTINITPSNPSTTFYMSLTSNTPAGSDARTCNEAKDIMTPKATFASVLPCLSAGSTLYIRAGTYEQTIDSDDLTVPVGTSADATITIAAYDGETVTFQAAMGGDGNIINLADDYIQYLVFDGFVFDGDGVGSAGASVIRLTGGAHHIRFINFEVLNGASTGVLVSYASGMAATNNEFLSCEVHDNGTDVNVDHGFHIRTSNNLIQDCDIYDNMAWGVRVLNDDGGAATSAANVVRANVLHGNGTGGTIGGGVAMTTGSGNAAYNNVIYENLDGILVCCSGSNTKIYNNTIVDNTRYGINVASGSGSGTLIRNNIQYSNTTDDSLYSVSVTQSNNMETDPSFTNAAADDYSIIGASAARNAGTTLSDVPLDILGVARPHGVAYDIGAYEATTPFPELRILTESLPDATEDAAYTCGTITATGGQPPYTWSTSGSLPTGISITDSGDVAVCSGTPTNAGTSSFSLVVSDSQSPAVQDTQAVQIVVAAAAASLPAGWVSSDVGQQGTTPGTVTYDDNGAMGESAEDVWTLTSSAPNIVGTADSFRAACKAITDDGSITALVDDFTGYTFAQAGVMIRETLDANSSHAFSFVMAPGNNDSNQCKARTTTGGTGTSESSGLTDNFYLRVTRVGNQFTRDISTDGTNFSQCGGSQTIVMASSAYACIAITNIQTSSVATANFTAIDVDDTPVDPPAEEEDFGGLRLHYQGFGATSLGGAGDTSKTICVVNSRLGTTGAPTTISGGALASDTHSTTVAHTHGTFNQCAFGADTGYVVFDTSGYHELSGERSIQNPYLTIAGQTAPAPVGLRNGRIWVDHRDIVFQHVIIRCGINAGTGTAVNGDAIGIRGNNNPAFNVVLDHMSMQWCGHESAGTSTLPNGAGTNLVRAQDILVVDSIMGANFSPVDADSKCFLTFGAANGTITFARNYMAHCANRNPWIAAGYRAAVYNNYGYNAVTFVGGDGQFGFIQIVGTGNYPESPVEAVIWGNVYQTGPRTASPDGAIGIHFDAAQVAAGNSRVHLRENTGPGITGTTQNGQWAGVHFAGTSATRLNSDCDLTCYDGVNMDWFRTTNYQILATAEVEAFVEANAGAWPTDRDLLDSQLMGDKDDNGSINVENETAMGGFAAYPLTEITTAFQIPANPHNAGDCGTKSSGIARTILECHLEDLARAIEPRWTP